MNQDEQIEQTQMRIARQVKIGIANIQASLMASGETYCRDCLDPIEAERLKVLPSATTCIFCAQITDGES